MKTRKKLHQDPTKKSISPTRIVAVGASAGGLDAFNKLAEAIPANSGASYILIQHLPSDSESRLVELLQKTAQIKVQELSPEFNVTPDCLYVVPPGNTVGVKDGKLTLEKFSNRDERLRPIDKFFSSLAEVAHDAAIGVVLSGTGADGTAGLKAIRSQGGMTITQDKDSAEFKEMPANAEQAGIVDFVLAPEEIPDKIQALLKGDSAGGDEHFRVKPEILSNILSLLHQRRGIDFSHYKQTTIKRRMLRRMMLHRKEDAAEYLTYVRDNPEEQDALAKDFLIHVTMFFRNPESFEFLYSQVLPKIVANNSTDMIRVWVAGCSTGEEAYSMAMCLQEYASAHGIKFQVFATDISEAAIAKARAGVYAKSEAEGIDAKRLHQFFTEYNGAYRVKKELRDCCVFAIHNFVKDPPFSKVDLISCRNVLIYMEHYLQKKALTVFHYALNPSGQLFLGKSETVGAMPELFRTVSDKNKLFMRKDVQAKIVVPALNTHREQPTVIPLPNSIDLNIQMDFQKIADDIVLSRYTPPGVIVNEAMDIVNYRGNTNDYLQQPPGKPSHNLYKLANKQIAFELRSIMSKLRKDFDKTKDPNQSIKKDNIIFKDGNVQYTLALEAIILPNVTELHYLVLFHTITKEILLNGKPAKKRSGYGGDETRIQQLERELAQAHDDMRIIAENQEVAYEEIQSANEELQSGAEELRSLNEELETSKEELQSTNEELTSVNQQLSMLNQQVVEERNFAQGVISTVREPGVVLDKDLRIAMANMAFYETFLMNETDTKGNLIFKLHNNQWNLPELRDLLERVLPDNKNFTDFRVTYHLPLAGERTMLLNAREILRDKGEDKLILLAMEDITEQEEINRSKSLLSSVIYSSSDAIFSRGLDDKILSWNKGAEVLLGYTEGEIIGKGIEILIPADSPNPEDLVKGRIISEQAVFHYNTVLIAKDGKHINVSLTSSPIRGDNNRIVGISGIARDITDELALHNLIEVSERNFKQLAEKLPDKVSTANLDGEVTYLNANWETYTGLTREQLYKDGWVSVVHLDDVEEVTRRWRTSVKTGQNFEMEMRLFNGHLKEYHWHLSRAWLLKDDEGKPMRWVGSMSDMQHQKEAEERLEIEVARRTAELQNANLQLQRKNHDLESFTYISSHDLQEPLRKIQIFVHRIESLEKEKLSEEGKDIFHRIESSVGRMRVLIQDLLTYSRVGTIEAKFTDIPIRQVVDNVLLELEDELKESKATVEVNLSCEAHVIEFQFHQLIYNLVSNSLKFSRPGIDPHIKISDKTDLGKDLFTPGMLEENKYLIPEKSYCKITISDNGVGFDMTYKEKIFEVFQRLFSRNQYPGTGIGLSIVKKVVDNHAGLITAHSAVDEGATFVVYIPNTHDGRFD